MLALFIVYGLIVIFTCLMNRTHFRDSSQDFEYQDLKYDQSINNKAYAEFCECSHTAKTNFKNQLDCIMRFAIGFTVISLLIAGVYLGNFKVLFPGYIFIYVPWCLTLLYIGDTWLGLYRRYQEYLFNVNAARILSQIPKNYVRIST